MELEIIFHQISHEFLIKNQGMAFASATASVSASAYSEGLQIIFYQIYNWFLIKSEGHGPMELPDHFLLKDEGMASVSASASAYVSGSAYSEGLQIVFYKISN